MVSQTDEPGDSTLRRVGNLPKALYFTSPCLRTNKVQRYRLWGPRKLRLSRNARSLFLPRCISAVHWGLTCTDTGSHHAPVQLPLLKRLGRSSWKIRTARRCTCLTLLSPRFQRPRHGVVAPCSCVSLRFLGPPLVRVETHPVFRHERTPFTAQTLPHDGGRFEVAPARQDPITAHHAVAGRLAASWTRGVNWRLETHVPDFLMGARCGRGCGRDGMRRTSAHKKDHCRQQRPSSVEHHQPSGRVNA